MSLSNIYYVQLKGSNIIGLDNLNNAMYKAYELSTKDNKEYTVLNPYGKKVITFERIKQFNTNL